jgi:integrase
MSPVAAVEGPKAHKTLLARLRRLNKAQSRKRRGSRNAAKAKRRLARLHARIANIRRDAAHKLTTRLTTTWQVIGIEDLNVRQRRNQAKALLWPWSRMTAFRRVQEVIAAADIPEGPHACPKGLRHGFGVQAVSRGIALNMVQKWLGHAQLTTTAIYANAVGEEEQSIAARMW